MSDIVERLRCAISTAYVEQISYVDLCDEAADEIERLRNDLEWMIKLHGWTPQPEEDS